MQIHGEKHVPGKLECLMLQQLLYEKLLVAFLNINSEAFMNISSGMLSFCREFTHLYFALFTCQRTYHWKKWLNIWLKKLLWLPKINSKKYSGNVLGVTGWHVDDFILLVPV